MLLAARSAQIERRLDSERVVEDEPIEATIEVHRGHWGLPGAAVIDPLAGKPIPLHAPMSLISGGRSASVRIVACFPRRGIRRIDPPSSGRGRRARARPGDSGEPVAAPRRSSCCRGPNGSSGSPAPGEKWRRAAGAMSVEPLGATEVDGLRPYRQGTPASRIHWPALARGAGLLERRLRADTDSRPLVVVDARGSGPPEHLDAAIRAAASLVLELGGRTGCGLLLPGEHRPLEVEPDLAAWPVAHARLALIEGGSDTRAPGLAPGARSSQVLYVAATPMARLPVGLTGAGVRAAVLVIPKALVTQPPQEATFEVAGCLGFVVGAGRRPRERAEERVA